MRYLLLTLTVLLPACTRDAPELPADSPELLTSSDDTSESARLLGFATRQQAFMRAVTASSSVLSEHVMAGLYFYDMALPRPPIARRSLKEATVPPEYFRTLNTRIDPSYATVESIELRVHRPNNVTVLARHPNQLSSITSWLHTGNEWKPIALSINVPDEVVFRFLNPPRAGG